MARDGVIDTVSALIEFVPAFAGTIEALHRDVDSSEGSYPKAGSNNRAG